jgi:hypothetical protein
MLRSGVFAAPRSMMPQASILRDAQVRALLRGWECFVFDGLQDTDRWFFG